MLTADELKSMPKGNFIVMKTGRHPMRTRLKLYFQWGITFGQPLVLQERGNRKVEYASKTDLMDGILKKYHVEEGEIEMNIPKRHAVKTDWDRMEDTEK